MGTGRRAAEQKLRMGLVLLLRRAADGLERAQHSYPVKLPTALNGTSLAPE